MIGPRSRGSRLYLLQLAAVVVGLVIVAVGSWRIGLFVVGGTFLVGAVGRAVMPEAHSGMLQVRGRAFDVVWTTLLGVSLVVLAVVIPNQPG